MARKKKEEEVIVPCGHCATVIHPKMNIQWCSQCECHMAISEIKDGVCLRCRAGENDEYIKRKPGIAARVEAALAEIHAKHGPFKPPFTGPLSQAYEAWCASPEYKDRFKPVDAPKEVTPEEDHDKWIDDFAGL